MSVIGSVPEPGTPLLPCRGAALTYAVRGWPVLPLHSPASNGGCSCGRKECSSPAKHPRTQHGLSDASTDPDLIKRWWGRWPQANVGIVTGQQSGIDVLDIDNRHNGMDSLRQLESRFGDLPITLTVRTGNGYHLYFSCPDGPVRNKVGVGGHSGLDCRGEGGYVVAPPSRHVNGNEYLWECGPNRVKPTPMPAWLAELVRMPAGSTNTSGTDAGPSERIPEGRRNDTLFRLACSLRTKGLSVEAITAALLAENARRCDPPLPAPEAEAIARNVVRYPDSANSANSAKPALGVDGWEPPTPFHEFDLPRFPTDVLPGPFREFVEAEATATQTPPDLAAMLVLAVCAATCAKHVAVQVDPGWTEPVNLFTATVQKPGSRKSAVFAAVVAPLAEHEAEACRREAPDVRAAQTRYNIAKGTLEHAERDAGKAPPEGREECVHEAERLARILTEMRVPKLLQFITDDATPERLSSLLYEQGGRMAVMSPEGGVFDLMTGRYSQNGTPNFEVFLKGHAGDDLRVDRVARGSEHVKAPALTLALAIQPQVLRGLMDKAGLRGRGLLARFLYSMPESLVGRRQVRPPSVPRKVSTVYAGTLGRLLELPWNADEDGNRVPHILHLDPDARDRLQAFEEWLEPQLGEDGDLASIADWGAKLTGAIVRLAGILHMIQYVGVREPWTTPINSTTIESTIQIGKYLIPHAKAAHALMGSDAVVEDAKHVLRWIQRTCLSAFSKRDAFEGTKGRFKKVADLEPAIALLCDHGYARERVVEDRPGPGRRSSPIYEVNLHLRSQNSHNSHNYPRTPDSANTANFANPDRAPGDSSEGLGPTPTREDLPSRVTGQAEAARPEA